MNRAEIEKLLAEDYPADVLRREWEESRISLYRDGAEEIEQLRAALRQCLALLDRAEAAERERDRMAVLLREVHGVIANDAEEACYGGFHGGDPRDFTPDPECSTEEERGAHAAACAEFAAAEARGEHPRLGDTHSLVYDDSGRLVCHIARNPYGLGTMVYRDEQKQALADRILSAIGADAKLIAGGA